ncbi:MAG: NADH:flavin oxidoreductase, partial [Candidatus Hydrogenedentota bacterium]
MSILFEPAWLGALDVKNRFVRSATWEGMAEEDGRCTPPLAELMGELAANEVGLVISSHAYVSTEGQAGPWQLGIYNDDMIEGLSVMAKRVHDAGGKTIVQLAHAGCQARSVLTDETPIGPSPSRNADDETCREMTHGDIARVVEAFGQAARRAKETGFDGVQIHAAHGFLLSQFLSPAFNRRTDEYGGGAANRARIVCDVFDAEHTVGVHVDG